MPKDIVLYGNLPSKKFYSDDLVSVDDVRRMSREFLANMEATGHPYILGTECDVLCVPGCEHTLMNKVMAVVNATGEDECLIKERNADEVLLPHPTHKKHEQVAMVG